MKHTSPRAAGGRRSALLLTGTLTVAVGAAGVAVASIPSATGQITGCYSRSTGALRVLDTGQICTSNERPLTWNQTGPQGPSGTALGPTLIAQEAHTSKPLPCDYSYAPPVEDIHDSQPVTVPAGTYLPVDSSFRSMSTGDTYAGTAGSAEVALSLMSSAADGSTYRLAHASATQDGASFATSSGFGLVTLPSDTVVFLRDRATVHSCGGATVAGVVQLVRVGP